MTAIGRLAENFAEASRRGARIPLAELEAEGLIPGTLFICHGGSAGFC